VEDAARHKIAAETLETGGVLVSMNAAAKRIDPAARPFPSSNAEAVEAWGRGEFERAVTLDPDFGTAWLVWAEKLQHGGEREHAIDVAAKALARTSLRSELDRARLELFSAIAKHDEGARAKAMADLLRLTPSDSTLLAALAAIEMNSRHFQEAAGHYRELLQLEPANAGVMNSLGYAQGFAGDLDGARKTFDEYGQQPGQKANSLDSLGEVYFMHGKFAEAEKYFLDAHQSNPALAAGGDLLKAAYAHWLTSPDDHRDVKGSDAIMARYLEFRRNQKDPLVAWREASWLYATGLYSTARRDQAIAKLAAIPNPQLVTQQTDIWTGKFQLTHDVESLKARFDNTPPASDAQVRVLYAVALIAAGRKDEARPLLELWPMPWTPGDAVLESWVLPKFIELRASLGIR
jgi:tetratricopeptide (TPR) repeat protein